MRVLLINPGVYDPGRRLIKQKRIWLPALTLPHLAALTPADIDVEIIDEITDDIPPDGNWDLVGLSSMGTGIVRAWEIGDYYRARGKRVVIGGIAATLGGAEKSLAHADAVVLGEAENVWEDVLRDAGRGRLHPVYAGPPADLAGLPVPRYDLFSRGKIGFWLPLLTSRGCLNRCRFCSVASVHKGTFRVRPLSEIARDIEAIKKLGFRKVAVVDDSVGCDLEFLKGLCRTITPFKIQWMSQCTLSVARRPDILALLAESGCCMLSIGLESLDPDNLRSIGKGFNRAEAYAEDIRRIRSYGIDVSTEMMLGLDGDREDVFEAFYRFIMQTSIAVPRIFIVTPIPGTPLYDEWSSEGRIYDHDIVHYSGSRLVFTPKAMSAEKLEMNYWQLYRRLFTVPAIFRRFLGSRPTRGALANLFFLAGNFHYRRHIRRHIPPGIV
jgi:radical SAM superfamily enzyme YgiQ (UPF0313 family)